MVKKIALEEHFLDPADRAYWRPTMVDVAPPKTAQLYASLTDFGEQRLQMMDKTGIARDGAGDRRARACRSSAIPPRRCGMRARPTIFSPRKCRNGPTAIPALPILPCRTPKAAADELERCVRELKFCGAMINGHTNGKYLDDRSYDPFWERAAALGAPIYLHPGRSGGAVAGACRPQCAGATDVGLGRRDRLARAAHHLRRRFPSLSESQARARPSRRDPAFPALALRQPLEALWLEFAEAAVAIHQGKFWVTTLGHV